MSAAVALAPQIGVALACAGLGVARATFYRARHARCTGRVKSARRQASPLALSGVEREVIRKVLHAPEHVDLSPRIIFARLLDAGHYLGSVSSFYRILRAQGEAWPRRNQLTHPSYARPELLASGPRELWSWDITKIKQTTFVERGFASCPPEGGTPSGPS